MLHNYPATQWYAEILSHESAPPALWFCHEPPRSLYGPQADRTLPVRPLLRRALRAIGNYRARLAGHAWRRVRVRVERNLAGTDRWRARLYSLDRAAVHAVEEVVANSHYTASRVARLYGRAARVVYPVPRDLANLEPGPQARVRRVLWVGRLTPAKRPLDLIEAWSRARGASPDLGSWSLHLVGDGPLAAEVQRALQTPGSSGVTWDRTLERRKLLDAYRSAALVIHLGIDEPLGLVPLEAMACGTPVLAHADGGVVETVEHGKTGWCVPLLNAAALADWLCGLPARASDLPGMGVAAVERVRSEFDPFRWSGEIVAVLEQLVGGRQRRDPHGM
jgi:glycosyltransferase involved in cell wall biosynthesis